MNQILLNLATNARDAMPQGGTITIETKEVVLGKDFYFFHGKGESHKYIRLSVSDNGFGMDDKTKEQIFNPFFTTKEVGKGTGLGLSIVYGIVKQHNGLIDVQSTPGRSTTFHLYFPAANPQDVEEKPMEPVLKNAPNGKEVILVAEDNTEVRQLTKEVLEGSGYTVLEARDGWDAIEKFAQNKDRINLVILDVVMPKKNGNEARGAGDQVATGDRAHAARERDRSSGDGTRARPDPARHDGGAGGGRVARLRPRRGHGVGRQGRAGPRLLADLVGRRDQDVHGDLRSARRRGRADALRDLGVCRRLLVRPYEEPRAGRAVAALPRARGRAHRRLRRRGRVLRAQGASLPELDRRIREGITALGFPGQPTHPICHGVGARAHEPPYAHQAGGGTVEENMVLALEPGCCTGRTAADCGSTTT